MTAVQQQGRIVPTFTRGDRLRKARDLTGLTQQAFAIELGIHRDSVRAYERDDSTPRKPVLTQWALRTGVDLDWLVNGDAVGDPAADTEIARKSGGPAGDRFWLPDLDSNQEPAGLQSDAERHGIADLAAWRARRGPRSHRQPPATGARITRFPSIVAVA